MCEASSRAQLKKNIDELAGQMKEINRRLPAHSAKPAMMVELFSLEDRYNELCRQLGKMDKDGKKHEY